MIDLKAQLEAAERETRRLKNERSSRIQAIQSQINAEFRDLIAVAENAEFLARKALTEYMVAEALEKHKDLAGRRVFKVTKQYGYGGRRREDKIERGVLEVRTNESKFSATVKYGLPEKGSLFVRMFKADGTPGLNFQFYGDGTGWSFENAQS